MRGVDTSSSLHKPPLGVQVDAERPADAPIGTTFELRQKLIRASHPNFVHLSICGTLSTHSNTQRPPPSSLVGLRCNKGYLCRGGNKCSAPISQAAMASAQPIQRPIQKILDPTKIGTWNIVRRPPIENGSIIQGKPREQSSNAFKTFQWQEGARLRKALNALTHGKNIFVYNNIRTNQVVYSLTRYLEVGLRLSTLTRYTSDPIY